MKPGSEPGATGDPSFGPNQPITPNQTESALGPDRIDMLTKETGLSARNFCRACRNFYQARWINSLPMAVCRHLDN
jgi:hypothetical protein